MTKIPTYGFQHIGQDEKLVDLFPWTGINPYKIENPHCHDYHEIMVFEKGGGSHEIDFNTYEIKSRSFHIIPRSYVHRLTRDIGSSGFTIAISQVFLEQLSRFDPTTDYAACFGKEQIINLSESTFDTFLFYFQELKKENTNPSILQNLCAVILLKLYPHLQENRNAVTGLIAQVRKVLEENAAKRLSATQYAALLHTSVNALNMKLKNATGKTIMQLQNELFIVRLKRELYASELSLKELADRYDFRDYAHFSKFFKQHAGYSPSQYREIIKNVHKQSEN